MVVIEYMKVNGKLIKEMVMVLKFSKMVTAIEASLLTINLTAKVFMYGQTERYMMENSFKDKKTALASGKACIMIVIRVSGKIIKRKVLELIFGAMMIDMRANGLVH